MVFMPAETTGKNRKLSLPYYGPYRILEVGTNTLLVRPVDKSAEQAIMINMERVVPCPGATRSVVAGDKGGKISTEEVSTEWQQGIQSATASKGESGH